MKSQIHLIYASIAASEFPESELQALLRQAREKNGRLGVTGILLHSEGGFFQVIEGGRAVVDDLFATIAEDPRHHTVTRIIRETILRRSFPHWTMGYSTMTRDELEAVPGLNGFFGRVSGLTEIDPGRARKLFVAFATGRWRARITGPALPLEAGE